MLTLHILSGFQISAVAWAGGSSLTDPQGSNVLLAAILWLEGTLLGTIARTLAIVAVASIGFMALSGRLEVRRALTVAIGCFVIFGASSIVAGIQSGVRGDSASALSSPAAPVVQSPLMERPPANRDGYDPYAGAAVPR